MAVVKKAKAVSMQIVGSDGGKLFIFVLMDDGDVKQLGPVAAGEVK